MAAAEDQTGAALLWQAKVNSETEVTPCPLPFPINLGTELIDTALSTQITLRVVLADNDIAALEAPPPLYLQVPRQGYLHSVLDTIDPLIRHALVPGTLKPWFSYNNLPLRWYGRPAADGHHRSSNLPHLLPSSLNLFPGTSQPVFYLIC